MENGHEAEFERMEAAVRKAYAEGTRYHDVREFWNRIHRYCEGIAGLAAAARQSSYVRDACDAMAQAEEKRAQLDKVGCAESLSFPAYTPQDIVQQPYTVANAGQTYVIAAKVLLTYIAMYGEKPEALREIGDQSLRKSD